MSRLAAFTLLACAAFAWSPPFLDRPGTAALGLGFLALAVGRKATLPRFAMAPSPPAAFAQVGDMASTLDATRLEAIRTAGSLGLHDDDGLEPA